MRFDTYILTKSISTLLFLTTLGLHFGFSQKSIEKQDSSVHKTRLYSVVGGSVIAGSGLSYGLYNAWYKQYPQSSFHLFNDGKEWLQMDKYGHIYSAYNQAEVYYNLLKWSGLSDNRSIWGGMIAGSTIQGVIEVFDGFSEPWGFSLWDLGANTAGVAIFGLQQHWWGEQRVRFKIWSYNRSYDDFVIPGVPEGDILFSERMNQLYGANFLSRFLKDYNAQSIWISLNVHQLLAWDRWPIWLNLAFGAGAEGLVGGFENRWVSNENMYSLADIPRERQYFLSFDIDWSHIQTQNSSLEFLFNGLNLLKTPAPTLALTSSGEWQFHLLFAH